MLCLALCEECGLVFFELAAGLARSSWHVVTALWCFGLESNQRLCGMHYLLSRAFAKNHEAMAGLVSVLWYLCYPSCSATELPKLI